MKNFKNINIEDYRYDLPEAKIARYPLDTRESSKLLHYSSGSISDKSFIQLPELLNNSQTLVLNNTRVIRSRLRFKKTTGAAIEIFCLEPYRPSNHEQALGESGNVSWSCLVGNLKKWKEGVLSTELDILNKKVILSARKENVSGNEIIINFTWDNQDINFGQILEGSGHVPVPPYLKRDDEPIDKLRYQTVYSEWDGSVAAPTAGLHFSKDILASLSSKGIKSTNITLHVGAGTFVPVKTETIGDHNMHNEFFSVSRENIEAMLIGNIIAVGTTSVRTVESIYTLGVKLLMGYNPVEELPHIDQWDPYSIENINTKRAINAVLDYMDKSGNSKLNGSTSVIIVPGYRFRIVKGLITNFHMPASTLLLLVSALIGDDWRKVYTHALENDYRFLSYGDSSLLLP